MDQVLSGMIAMGFAVAGVFFLRFWRDSRDRLFAMFALSFLVMAGSRVAVALSDQPAAGPVHYWVRLVAFSLILVAVLDKNRPRDAPPARTAGPLAPSFRSWTPRRN